VRPSSSHTQGCRFLLSETCHRAATSCRHNVPIPRFWGKTGFGEAVVEDPSMALQHTFHDDLEQSIIDLRLAINAAEAELFMRVEGFERRELPRPVQQLTTAARLRRFCRVSITRASGRTKYARAVTRMSHISAREGLLRSPMTASNNSPTSETGTLAGSPISRHTSVPRSLACGKPLGAVG